MCGIYGEFRSGGTVDLAAATARLQQLAHRGPDGWGVAYGMTDCHAFDLLHNPPSAPSGSDADFFVGHRRLAIIDLSERALQPMQSGDGAHLLVFNGEIYNFGELRKRLEALGHVFVTDHSDSEVLLCAYQEWGEACVDELCGMFAFAIYDRRAGRVFLARDRVGQKPLYYIASAGCFAFASELPPLVDLLEREGAAPAIDETALAQYLMLGYVPDPRSIFGGILRLPPAHVASFDVQDERLELRCYWEPPLRVDEALSAADAERRVAEALRRAVERRLISDVPIGCFVSGGIDSTLVAKMAAEVGAPLSAAFSADFAEARMSERRWVDEAAAHYGLDVRHAFLDGASPEIFEEVTARLDEPFDGGSAIPSHELYGLAKGDVTVVLTGDGGDELFAGYGRYLEFARVERWLSMLARLRIALPLLRFLLPLFRRSRRYSLLRALAQGDVLMGYAVRSSMPWMLDLLARPPKQVDALYDYVEEHREKLAGLGAKAAQYLDFRTILPGRMLYKADRLSMSRGLEVRSPFMDHELIELAFRIPTRLHLAGGELKKILRDIVAADMGRDFVDRPKHGFGNPLASWFESEAGAALLRGLADEHSALYHYLDYDRTLAAYPQIRAGFDGSKAQELWRLLVLARYLERHRAHPGEPAAGDSARDV